MTPADIDEAAQILAAARTKHEPIDEIPLAVRPRTLPEAYAVQDRLAELLGWPLGGWFCACTNERIQAMLGLAEPYYARLFGPYIFESGVVLPASEYPPIVLECEFAFRLRHDLPPRAEPYSRREVETAVATVHPAIEVVAGHLKNWPEQDVFSVIADNGTDGALVHGDGLVDWRRLDLRHVEVELTVNGKVERQGTGANVLGDPLTALVWLANARAAAGDGLRAGDIHNTGTATDIIWMRQGDAAVATFKGLGEAALSLE